MNEGKHILSYGRTRKSVRRISYVFASLKVGDVIIGATSKGICVLEFVCGTREKALISLGRRFPCAELVEEEQAVHLQAMEYLSDRSVPSPPLDLVGTEFQKRVWERLCGIPFATTATYSEIARSVDRPLAVRAVANAIGANSIAVIVPCHRVIRSDGSLGGYRWGTERKIALLAAENNRMQADLSVLK